MRGGIFLTVAVVSLWASAANAACKIPANVAEYLSKNKDWKVVEEAQLAPGDRKLWNEEHAGQCPGLAGAAIKGDGKPVFAAALLSTTGAETQQKLVLFDGSTVTTLVEARPAKAPAVVWVTGPGEQEEVKTSRKITTKNNAFIYEQMEAAMQIFYFADGKVQSLQLSD